MSTFSESILNRYFQSHKDLIDFVDLGDDTVVVSFPVYFSANHRVELAVKKLPDGDLQISDMAKTISELKLAGIQIKGTTRDRILELAKNAKLRFVGNTMFRECKPEQIGDVLHLFADSAKTIGDAYLAHHRRVETEDELRLRVRNILVKQSYPFKESQKLQGEIEKHQVDFYIPPNGIPGLALSVLPNPSRLAAEAWVFKSSDIKVTNKRLRVGLVYGAETAETPKKILSQKIEIAIPSSDLGALEHGIIPKIQ
jgi:hypothetical protein